VDFFLCFIILQQLMSFGRLDKKKQKEKKKVSNLCKCINRKYLIVKVFVLFTTVLFCSCGQICISVNENNIFLCKTVLFHEEKCVSSSFKVLPQTGLA